MPTNAKNRKVARAALASLLSNALTGAGGLVNGVYGYDFGGWQQEAPVVLVASAGTLRRRRIKTGVSYTIYTNGFRFAVLVLVPDAHTGNNWTEEMVEDRLDDIEAAIANVVGDNIRTANWDNLEFVEEFSDVSRVVKEGLPYKQEVFMLLADPVTD